MFAGMRPLALKEWGGLVTVEDPLAVVAGASPDCQDVEFTPGSFRTRAGLSSLVAPAGAFNPIYLKAYVANDTAIRRLLMFDSGGTLYREAPEGTLSVVESGFTGVGAVKSATAFGREFLAFSDGRIGTGYARQYSEDAAGNPVLDPVGQPGPGGAPTATTNAAPGNIVKGEHQVVVLFVTRSGYITAPSPPAAWTASGSEEVDVTNIPIGPANVIKRILAFTMANDTRFYWLAGTAMEIDDNTTTSVTGIDFVDSDLANGESLDDQGLLNQITLPAVAGFIEYKGRLVSWGSRNFVPRVAEQGPLNLTFDGGWNGNVPLGWNEIVAGGQRVSGAPGSTGDCFAIVGAGTMNDCKIENQVKAQNFLLPNTEYKARVRARKVGASVGGAAAIYTTGIGGIETVGFVLPFNTLTTDFAWYEGVVLQARPDMNFNVGFRVSNSTLSNLDVGAQIQIDAIEIFPTTSPFNGSLLNVSRPFQPESLDGLTGGVSVAPEDGQDIRTCFVIRNILYVVKDDSIYATSDNGDDPATWTVDHVSGVVGARSLYSAAGGEDWIAIASINGLYIFTGGSPSCFSTEIENTWRRINWAAGSTIWLEVDPLLNRIYVGVPLGAATSPSHVLVLDYTRGMEFDPAAPGAGRKWCIWTIKALAGVFVKRASLAFEMLFGTSDGSGVIAKLDSAATDDLGAVIPSYYVTSYYGADSGNLLFGYLTANVSGKGEFIVTATRADGLTSYQQPTWTLHDPSDRDLEGAVNIRAERLKFKLASGGLVGDYIVVKRFVPYVASDPWAPIAGWNV